jgi:hypothetical protein
MCKYNLSSNILGNTPRGGGGGILSAPWQLYTGDTLTASPHLTILKPYHPIWQPGFLALGTLAFLHNAP